MNKKILSILGTTVISVSLTTQLSFASQVSSENNMKLAYSQRYQANAQQIIDFAKQQFRETLCMEYCRTKYI